MANNPETSQVKNQSIGEPTCNSGEAGSETVPAVLQLGGPNAAHTWIVNYLAINYKQAVVEPLSIPPKTDYGVKPIGRVLLDGSVLLSEVQGETVHDTKSGPGEFKAKQFGPITTVFQFVQSPEIPPGHSLVVEFELIPSGGKFGSAKATQGICSLGYTIKTVHAFRS